MLRAVLALARGDMAPPSGVEPSDVPPACSGLALPHAGSAMITSTTRCRTGERRRPGEGGGSPVPKRAKALSPGSSRPQRACDVCTDDQENAPAGEPLEACHADAETAETLRCGGGSSGSDVLSPGAALVLRPGLGELVSPAGCDWNCWLPQHGSCVAAEPGAASISACADTSCDVVPVPPALSASATGSQQNAGSPSSSSAPSVSGMAPLPQQPSHSDAAASDAAVAVAAASLMQQTSPSGAQCADSGGSECSEDGRFDEEEFDPLLFIGTLGPVDAYVIGPRQPLLPRQTRTCKQKTLVLDLDETLVHSTLDAGVGVGADFSFPVTFNGTEHTVHVRERPHMREFLARVATLFEVVVFTASQKVYAEKLLNILDPARILIRHRIYRDSCVYVDGNYLKDLSVLGRDLARCAIVDNSPQAFGFQLANGIPIESWYDDPDDSELLELLPFLEALSRVNVADVRPAISARFRLAERVRDAGMRLVGDVAAAAAAAAGAAAALQQQPQQLVGQLPQAVPAHAQAQQA